MRRDELVSGSARVIFADDVLLLCQLPDQRCKRSAPTHRLSLCRAVTLIGGQVLSFKKID
jgi:hypothetical protein